MKAPHTMTRTELRLRFLACVGVVGFAFAMIILRLGYLQVVNGRDYRYQSENNRIRIERLNPPRGVVLDRNRNILADTRAAFDVAAIPTDIPKDKAPSIYYDVSKILGTTPEILEHMLKARGLPKWKPRLVKRNLSREEMAKLEARRIEFPGFMVIPNPVRNYPNAELMSGLMGYIGGISLKELSQPEFEDYSGLDYIGRTGIERHFEKRLRGTPGGIQVQVDVLGRRLGVLAEKSATPGQNLVLTVDERVQKAAELALGEETGSVVAVDVLTGNIIAMASRPGFDPNVIARGMNAKEWATLTGNERKPLQFKPTQGLYAPGSTFKIVMALAGLDSGVITPSTTVHCSGGYSYSGRVFGCWKREGHGSVDLEAALAHSCDVYFYQLGLKLGVDSIAEYSTKLGLGAKTEIDLPNEKGGLVPSSEWKKRVKKQKWYSGETLSYAIGQGYLLTTPLQLAMMTASVAHPSAKRLKPRLLDHVEDLNGNVIESFPAVELGRLPFNETNLASVRKGLLAVVSSGTARKAHIDGINVAGKTGTSQVVGMKKGEQYSDSIEWEKRDHALFVCYAPYVDPKIAVAVVVEHGGHGGSAAAPIAAKVIRAYLRPEDPIEGEEGAVADVDTTNAEGWEEEGPPDPATLPEGIRERYEIKYEEESQVPPVSSQGDVTDTDATAEEASAPKEAPL